MKKTIIMSLLAALFSVLTVSAQENTYSIVIKMQNGTVFTIGPNEADSIFFDEGQLKVSGQSIEKIMEKVKNDSILMMNLFEENKDYLDYNIAYVKKNVVELQAQIDNLQAQVYYLNDKQQKSEDKLMLLSKDVERNYEEMKYYTDRLEAMTKEQQDEINQLKMANANLEKRIAYLEDIINNQNQ